MSLSAAPSAVDERGRPDLLHLLLRASTTIAAGFTTAALYEVTRFGDERYLLPLLVGVPVSMLLGFAASVRSTMAGGIAVRDADAPTPETEAPWTLARVENIRRTGITMNHQPLCDLDLVVADDSGARGYRTTLRTVVDVVDLPQRQPGCVLVVQREDPDRPEVRITATPGLAAEAAAEAERRSVAGSARVPAAAGLPTRVSEPQPLLTYRGPSNRRVLLATLLFVAGWVVAVVGPDVLT